MLGTEQEERTPDDLLFRAPREASYITGSEAVAEAVRRANVDMAIEIGRASCWERV